MYFLGNSVVNGLALALITLWSVVGAGEIPADSAKAWGATVQPFLAEHCLRCHGPQHQESGRRFDALDGSRPLDAGGAALLGEMLEAIGDGSMPPKREPRPAPAQLAAVIAWMGGTLRTSEHGLRGSRQVVLRRMTRREYARSVRDLLGIATVLDPIKAELDVAEILPVDTLTDGFDNVGSELGLSVVHLNAYFEAADRLLARVLDPRPERPASEHWRFDFSALPLPADAKPGTFPGATVAMTWQPAGATSLAPADFTKGSPAALRQPAWGDNPFRLYAICWKTAAGDFVTSRKIKGIKGSSGGESLGLMRFRAHEPGLYRVRVRAATLETGPEWTGGPLRLVLRDFPARRILARSADLPESGVETEALLYAPTVGHELGFEIEPHRPTLAGGKGEPCVGVDWFEIEGPVVPFAGWPAPYLQRLVGDGAIPTSTPQATQRAQQVLTAFLPRAWRRPVTASEIAVHTERFASLFAAGRGFHEALRGALTQALCSPHFIYLVETGAPGTALTSHEQAARLAAFLWRSIPDAELTALAAQGRLAAAIPAQVERMLRDPRARPVLRDLADAWFGLTKLDTFDPDDQLFPTWDDRLAESVRDETYAVLAELVATNGSLLDLVDSRWTMLNERLARHYGITGVTGPDLRRVVLDPAHQRGGVLTHASILAATSTGQRTSPVLRGVWLRDRLLADPPPPPPANVPQISDKVDSVQLTVPMMLAAHRAKGTSCAACHQNIDPWGMAFEGFDGIGALRSHEAVFDPKTKGNRLRQGAAIAARDELPDGTKLDGMAGLKQALLGPYRERFVEGSIRHLMTFAAGRLVGPLDRDEVTAIRDRLAADRWRMRDLIIAVVQSAVFQKK